MSNPELIAVLNDTNLIKIYEELVDKLGDCLALDALIDGAYEEGTRDGSGR